MFRRLFHSEVKNHKNQVPRKMGKWREQWGNGARNEVEHTWSWKTLYAWSGKSVLLGHLMGPFRTCLCPAHWWSSFFSAPVCLRPLHCLWFLRASFTTLPKWILSYRTKISNHFLSLNITFLPRDTSRCLEIILFPHNSWNLQSASQEWVHSVILCLKWKLYFLVYVIY